MRLLLDNVESGEVKKKRVVVLFLCGVFPYWGLIFNCICGKAEPQRRCGKSGSALVVQQDGEEQD